MRRPRTPGQMVHSVSATDLDWERVRERADAAGMSISRYLVERARTVELEPDAGGEVRPAPRLAWDEDEQRAMRERIERIHDRVSTGSAAKDRAVLTEMSEIVSALYAVAFLDMVRGGRTGQLTALVAAVVGEERAVRQVEAFLTWARGKGLLD